MVTTRRLAKKGSLHSNVDEAIAYIEALLRKMFATEDIHYLVPCGENEYDVFSLADHTDAKCQDHIASTWNLIRKNSPAALAAVFSEGTFYVIEKTDVLFNK